MYKRLEDVSQELNHLWEKGVVRGKSVGWDWKNLPFTIKEGCTTYIAASPTSGKTEFWLEILINLSCLHGWNHIIFTPETGEPKDIFAEICRKYIGKSYLPSENQMDIRERTKAELFVSQHFILIDPMDEDLTIQGFYQQVDKIERELSMSFHTTTIDPWNELTEDYLPNDLGREDKYLSRILGFVRKNARKTGRHNCVINHCRDIPPITKDGITYYPPPTARDFAGGQAWYRKGLLMLILWRPPFGLCDGCGIPYQENETILKIAKSKPKGVSINGTYKIFLDVEKYQYYMMDMFNTRIYANRNQEVKYIANQELINFYEPKESEKIEDIEYIEEVKSLKTNDYEEHEDFFKMPPRDNPF